MELKNYICEEGSSYEGITFMENAGTKHRIVLKRADMERGITELKAYQGMCGSPLIDYAIDKDGVVLMLQRHEGENLADMLADTGKKLLLAENLSRVLESALVCLKKIHSFGICHGGITPEKLIISEDFSVEIVGYGNASGLENPVFNEVYSKYTAPEVVLGARVDARLADYYSLGRVLEEICRSGEKLECIDYDTLEKIARLSSVIPSRREL